MVENLRGVAPADFDERAFQAERYTPIPSYASQQFNPGVWETERNLMSHELRKMAQTLYSLNLNYPVFYGNRTDGAMLRALAAIVDGYADRIATLRVL